jgi:sensor histidine kinase YesM
MFVSAANARPIIAISAPVWQDGKVIAVIRAIIDMAFFDEVLLKPEDVGSKGRSGILDPNFEMKLPENFVLYDVIKGKEYRPLEIPARPEEFAAESGIIQYYDKKRGDILAAFHRFREPEWVLVVEEPLQEILAPIRNVGRITFATAIFLIAAMFGVVFFIVNPRLRSILQCLNLAQEIGAGNLEARLDLRAQDEIGKLAEGLNAMAANLQKAERQRHRAEEAESRLAQSRLQALRYQINPHFLFNILNSIDALAKQAPRKIPELIRELSRYLRFTLTEQAGGLVPLHLELDAITSYLKLEKIRFEENLEVEFITSPDCGQALVPELLLQPLVENAVKYGMKTSPLPLRIAIKCSTLTGKNLEIEVANTGEWLGERDSGRDGNGIGLLNLRQRLALLYPDASSLRLESRDGWVFARVELPLARAEKDVH